MQFRPIPVAATVLALSLVAFGCASTDTGEEQSPPRDWTTTPGGKDGGTTSPPGTEACIPATCQSLGKTSGSYPDGCAGPLLDCNGAPACTPKTCQDLGKTSGTTDDGCGKTIDCACTDAKESNNTKETAPDIGAMTDSPNSSRIIPDLTQGDGDEDWFQFKVTDAGFGGNPLIEVSTTIVSFEVSVFYVCDSQPDSSTCKVATDTADNTVGKGCRGTGKVALATSCGGVTNIDDSGRAYVRVKKPASDTQCTTYALTVKVS